MQKEPMRNASALEAERTRFELVVQFDPYVGLANRWFQPLTHLSSHPYSGFLNGTTKLSKNLLFPKLSHFLSRKDRINLVGNIAILLSSSKEVRFRTEGE